jgi:hypothetical protein
VSINRVSINRVSINGLSIIRGGAANLSFNSNGAKKSIFEQKNVIRKILF